MVYLYHGSFLMQYWWQALSITSSCQLLLVDEEAPLLSIYNPDATLHRTITLPSDMKFPRHAVETPTGNFIICYRDYNMIHRVCEVTTNGTAVRSYDGIQEGIV